MVGWTHTTVHKHYEIMQRELEMTQMMSPPAWILVQLLRLRAAVILYVIIPQRVSLEVKGIRRKLRPFRSERGKVPTKFPHGGLDTFKSSSSPFYRAQFWNHAEEKRREAKVEKRWLWCCQRCALLVLTSIFQAFDWNRATHRGSRIKFCCRD